MHAHTDTHTPVHAALTEILTFANCAMSGLIKSQAETTRKETKLKLGHFDKQRSQWVSVQRRGHITVQHKVRNKRT